jgi:phenylacetate-CoA ligase
MPTNLELELAEQSRWRLRPEWSNADWFDRVLRNEFLAPNEHRRRENATVAALIRTVAARVPYYRNLLKRLRTEPGDVRGVADLAILPPLTRTEVQERGRELQPDNPAPQERPTGTVRTSGSTGKPVVVLITPRVFQMFAVFKQREWRWFRFDPSLRFGSIRPADDLPPTQDGKLINRGQASHLPYWPLVGVYFRTGPFIGFSNRNSIEAQAQWLRENRPDYLLMQAAELEHLALQFPDDRRDVGLKGCLGISQQLTDEMRARIERAFGVPVGENYGLNEVGLVATRCPEGGRYHVHTENCFVEIVDKEGNPCRPGEWGRILVTSFANPAQRLIRYDADDLAQVAEGPCACGRTLPSFAGLRGRYRRTSLLPPGTWEYWIAFQMALTRMPHDVSRPLRQYQLHQFKDGRFELRLVTTAPLSEQFESVIQDFWEKEGPGTGAPLRIVTVEEIPLPAGGKFQNFTSDFAPLGPEVAMQSASTPVPS